mgnify:CR=1 FL=1
MIDTILFDLDNTITPVKMKTPSKKTKKFFSDLKEKGFKVIIFSNSPKKRVKPFKDALDVDCAASAHKPHPKKFLQVLKEYEKGKSYAAIAEKLNAKVKSVDTAIQRIRKKANKIKESI